MRSVVLDLQNSTQIAVQVPVTVVSDQNTPWFYLILISTSISTCFSFIRHHILKFKETMIVLKSCCRKKVSWFETWKERKELRELRVIHDGWLLLA